MIKVGDVVSIKFNNDKLDRYYLRENGVVEGDVAIVTTHTPLTSMYYEALVLRLGEVLSFSATEVVPIT